MQKSIGGVVASLNATDTEENGNSSFAIPTEAGRCHPCLSRFLIHTFYYPLNINDKIGEP